MCLIDIYLSSRYRYSMYFPLISIQLFRGSIDKNSTSDTVDYFGMCSATSCEIVMFSQSQSITSQIKRLTSHIFALGKIPNCFNFHDDLKILFLFVLVKWYDCISRWLEMTIDFHWNNFTFVTLCLFVTLFQFKCYQQSLVERCNRSSQLSSR